MNRNKSTKFSTPELPCQTSINTVAGYVRQIYQTLDVHSHTELVARFYQGNQGELMEHRGCPR